MSIDDYQSGCGNVWLHFPARNDIPYDDIKDYSPTPESDVFGVSAQKKANGKVQIKVTSNWAAEADLENLEFQMASSGDYITSPGFAITGGWQIDEIRIHFPSNNFFLTSLQWSHPANGWSYTTAYIWPSRPLSIGPC